MGRVGFEPTKRFATDLQSAPFGHSGISPKTLIRLKDSDPHVKPTVGFEPTTA